VRRKSSNWGGNWARFGFLWESGIDLQHLLGSVGVLWPLILVESGLLPVNLARWVKWTLGIVLSAAAGREQRYTVNLGGSKLTAYPADSLP
jgi:hypothetical protein